MCDGRAVGWGVGQDRWRIGPSQWRCLRGEKQILNLRMLLEDVKAQQIAGQESLPQEQMFDGRAVGWGVWGRADGESGQVSCVACALSSKSRLKGAARGVGACGGAVRWCC